MKRVIRQSIVLSLITCTMAFVALGALSSRTLPQEEAGIPMSDLAHGDMGAWKLASR